MPAVTEQIRAVMPRLSAALEPVGRFVLDNPELVAASPVSQVAREAGASPAAVVRFCQAVGLGGYQELRLRLAEERGRAESQWETDLGREISATDPIERVAAVVANTDVQMVQRTVAQLDLAVVEQVAEAVAVARRVDVFGIGGSGAAAQELHARLFRIGVPSQAWTEGHAAETCAALLGEGDVAIGISHSGVTREVVEPLRLAAEHGALTVAISNYPASPLARAAGLTLTTAVVESSYRQGGIGALHAQLVVVDCLYIRVAQLTHDRATVALERTAGLHARHAVRRR